VAKKPRNRGGAGPARAGTARPVGVGRAPAGRTEAAKTGTAQLTAPTADQDPTSAAAADDDRTPPAAADQDPATSKHPAYPGQRFGLPEHGPMSVASMGRRVLALLIDWLLSMLIAYWLTHSQFWTIAVFALEVYVLTALTGFTVGKRLCGIRVMRTNGGLVGFGWALVRTAILLTVVPPLLTDRDLRGMHDRAADTIVVRL
jgi:hypothetical protein